MTRSSSLDKHKPKVLHAKFNNAISGYLKFIYINDKKTLVIGQFCSGFEGSSNCSKIIPSPNGYKIRIVRRPQCPSFIPRFDLSHRLRYKITPSGGTSEMKCDFKFGLDDIKGLFAQVSQNRKVIDFAPIK
ncbi:6894_t:CDS:1 [Diversispora eburnea]|uniref:6894_t:CDS:1 n=1 Tax=Diversispora eburnea TaxID=1213867 RepID=A0A9N8V363_9GLOM|nr:6894_t:CDS:1 [Diversispora eburnea]